MRKALENGLADELMQRGYGKLCAYVGARLGVKWTVGQHGTPNGQFADLLKSNKKDLCYANTSLLSRWVERNSPLLGGSYVSPLADELNISTEQDLRKLKDENSTMYQ